MTDKPDKSNAERQARFREKSKTAGLKRKVIWIPIEREEELTRTVAEWIRIKQEGATK